MSQFLNRTAGQAKTSDPIALPVSIQELVDWLVLPSMDPTLLPILRSATEAVIQHLGYDLLARDWVLTHWDWPTIGTATRPTLSGQNGELAEEIALPFANLISVGVVEIFGVASTNFTARTESLVFNPLNLIYDEGQPSLVVNYRAGYGEDESDIPDSVKQAIIQAAAFNFENRGGCDAQDALKKSGAANLLQPHVKPSNVVLF